MKISINIIIFIVLAITSLSAQPVTLTINREDDSSPHEEYIFINNKKPSFKEKMAGKGIVRPREIHSEIINMSGKTTISVGDTSFVVDLIDENAVNCKRIGKYDIMTQTGKTSMTCSKSNNKEVDLTCMRAKDGKVIQKYIGKLIDNKIFIDNKNYTDKYSMSTELDAKNKIKSGEKSHLCYQIDIKAEKTILKCARIKDGNIIQTYDGFMRNNSIIINNKDYSAKYKVVSDSIDDIKISGATGHFCNIVQ